MTSRPACKWAGLCLHDRGRTGAASWRTQGLTPWQYMQELLRDSRLRIPCALNHAELQAAAAMHTAWQAARCPVALWPLLRMGSHISMRPFLQLAAVCVQRTSWQRGLGGGRPAALTAACLLLALLGHAGTEWPQNLTPEGISLPAVLQTYLLATLMLAVTTVPTTLTVTKRALVRSCDAGGAAGSAGAAPPLTQNPSRLPLARHPVPHTGLRCAEVQIEMTIVRT